MAEIVFKSPDDIMNAAKNTMLEGREPKTKEDWVRIVNYIAAQVPVHMLLSVMSLLLVIYSIEEHMTKEEYLKITKFQSMVTLHGIEALGTHANLECINGIYICPGDCNGCPAGDKN